MKYKDNGQWKEIYIKALDSMPVGTEVDFDGQTSDIPVGWEQVNNKVVLYENPNGTNTNVTVSDDLYNYDYVDIVYGKTSKKSIYVARIVVPKNINDYSFSLNRTGSLANMNLILEYTDYSYANKVITPTTYYEVEIKNNQTSAITSYNGNYIFKVIGYKEV